MQKNNNINKSRITTIIAVLQEATKSFTPPASYSIVKQYGKNPYLILVSCILSLRTKDPVSLEASRRLFFYAKTPEAFLALTPTFIEKTIYPVGFYRRKTQQLRALSTQLLTQFNGIVPHTKKELLSLPGVGLKTANLVLGVAFDIPALCVDTHVHRIANRLGIINTQTVEETEIELKRIIPQEHWVEFGGLLVMWGQNMCVPLSPFCSRCPLLPLCDQKSVTKSR